MSSPITPTSSADRALPPEPRGLKVCPRCRSELVIWLVQMRRFDDSGDWYRCRACEHEFTVDRTV